MTINESLDMLEELLENAKQVPFANKKVLVDPDRVRTIIDDMHYNMPSEIKKAESVMAERDKIIADAHKKADQLMKTAEERAKILIANETIVKQARELANDIVAKANSMEKEIREAMMLKIDKLFAQTEKSFANGLAEIKQSRAAIKAVSKKKKDD
ncbi:MAG: hypothetical protein IJ401_02810 [Oscillospiraceae bacterium]|nr:hypothetical protein [Oscillospiraceae bacterium]